MRDSHRVEAERLVARAVEEEVRRSGGRIDGGVLLSRARGALDAMAETATEEYEAYTRALDEAAAGQLTFGQRYAKEGGGTPLLVAGVAATAAVVADLVLGTGAGTALGAGVTVGVVGAAATVVKVAGSHLPAAHHQAGAASQPGGPEQLRLSWLTALEVRGIRPFLDQQRVRSASTGPKKTGPRLKGADKSAAARGRNVLEQSFGQLPEPVAAFAGRRQEVGRIRHWVQSARASTETRPTVVVLHGPSGSGRSTLALHAAHDLRDHFRGACVVDLRGDSPEEPPLPTRDALLHLLNRLGAPREQLLFRERSSPDQQVKRLSELYHQHLTGLPVTVVLDDASDP
ncbi:MAG: ATP-binding protein, partial [Streptomyces sp.]|nr:ATP-binding protein [Streptomyces sp.]